MAKCDRACFLRYKSWSVFAAKLGGNQQGDPSVYNSQEVIGPGSAPSWFTPLQDAV
jgi:hypothetical protein